MRLSLPEFLFSRAWTPMREASSVTPSVSSLILKVKLSSKKEKKAIFST
jgi:hypothetical protein